MPLTADKKKEIFKKFNTNETDTGTPEGQIAMFTSRIEHLTAHLNNNKKDVATERSLVLMVGKRRRLLNYLKTKDIERYREIVKKLKLRK
jgi:small subunit ribosomal protein S15